MSQASVDISSTTQTVREAQKRIRKLKKLTTIDTLKLTGFLLYQRENNDAIYKDKGIKAVYDDDGKLMKMMTADGKSPADLVREAWGNICQEVKDEWNDKAMSKKLEILRSETGKRDVLDSIIKELVYISDKADKLKIVFVYFMKIKQEPGSVRVTVVSNNFSQKYFGELLERNELARFDNMTHYSMDPISADDASKFVRLLNGKRQQSAYNLYRVHNKGVFKVTADEACSSAQKASEKWKTEDKEEWRDKMDNYSENVEDTEQQLEKKLDVIVKKLNFLAVPFFSVLGRQTVVDDGVCIYPDPFIMASIQANEFMSLFLKRQGVASYHSVIKKCRISKQKVVTGVISYEKMNVDGLRLQIRKVLKDMCTRFTNQKAVPFTNLSSWEYEFTGLPTGVNLSNFTALKRPELDKIAKNINSGELCLKRKRANNGKTMERRFLSEK